TQADLKDGLLANEPDLLRGLLEAAGAADEETQPVEIARNGRVLFAFRLRPLREREYEECQDQSTKYERNRQFGGMRVPQDRNMARYRSLLIYRATVEADRTRLWDNKEAWERLKVLNGADLIERVLKAGEKEAVVAKIDELSGYGAEVDSVARDL
ncbi:MAG: phage tail assembly chaperone, partial [Geminicoccales bacterium]